MSCMAPLHTVGARTMASFDCGWGWMMGVPRCMLHTCRSPGLAVACAPVARSIISKQYSANDYEVRSLIF